jgi:hypothetical protein
MSYDFIPTAAKWPHPNTIGIVVIREESRQEEVRRVTVFKSASSKPETHAAAPAPLMKLIVT